MVFGITQLYVIRGICPLEGRGEGGWGGEGVCVCRGAAGEGRGGGYWAP